uniref:nitrate reductase n=1 Tax=Novosphingobium sp. TaxID=1874826 RepID=UPI00286E49C2
YYVANKLMKGFIGSGNIDTNSRLCMASAVAAHNRAFGEDVVPCTYDDLDDADLILLVGSNTAWCHPVIWQRIEAARERRGTKLVVIDPRRTETAEQADLHVAIPPDGDVALFNALLADMAARGLAGASECDVPSGFWADLTADHGIDPSVFASLADLVAAHPAMITLFSQGANQSTSGTDKGNAIINLHLATGRINRSGAGPFSITGQPNAMGGREVGGLANMLACHLGFSAAERDDVRKFWAAPNLAGDPGLKAVDMFRAVHDGRIKFLWVMATNPAVSMPDAGFVREALARCATVVVSEVMADTDTSRFAHIRLPALGWGEKDGTVTNSERMISRQRAVFAAPGEARADWQIICDVASRLGWGDAFDFTCAADVFREYAAMTRLSIKHGRKLDLARCAGLTDAEYADLAPFRWGGAFPLASGYPTPSGKARLVSTPPPVFEEDAARPLLLNTGRYRDQWHTMTRTGLSPTLSQHRREPLLELHPSDAAGRGLDEGDLARVTTASGAATFRVTLSEGQRRGDIFVPMHWTDMMAGEGRANRLPGQAVDAFSGQPGFKRTPAEVEKVQPEWRAFLATQQAADPVDLLWWSRARVAGGWLYELAGHGTVDVDALLPEGERIEAADMTRGMRRIAVRGPDGSLRAALYVTRSGELPPRDWASNQLGQTEAGAVELLAGRPSTPVPDRGAIVCVCHGIGELDIAAAARSGAATVEAIGEKTCAGTNCGSCRPAIARLLESVCTQAMEAAE